MADLPRMNDEQLKQVRKLIKQRCCNYDQGSCLVLDWSFCNICPQWISYSLNCKWFRNAVLPNDPALEAAILQNHQKRVCEVCGNPLSSDHPQTKYCPECAVQQRRKQQAEWARKKRGAASTF
ncbi:MAG: cysteine-rich VLP protein [Eubacteriales bacterium]|nr:cysteine-rich VLP protein [Eubacteriales bacterium]